MTTPATGPISLLDLQNEFGGVAPISFDEYYRGGAFVNSLVSGVPASGTLDLNAYRGKQKIIGGNSGILTSGTAYTLPITSGTSINVLVIGGGGGGGGGSGRTFNSGYYTGGGGGGSSTAMYVLNIPVTPGQTVNYVIGAGGGGGGARDGRYSSGSNGAAGGLTSLSVNGVVKASSAGGSGGINSPTGTGGAAGLAGSSVGVVARAGTAGYNAGSGTTRGGQAAKGFTINTTATNITSIVGYGVDGTLGGTEGSGVRGTSGTVYGAGGSGGGCAQSDVYNYTNMLSSGGTTGAVFIWWGV